MAVSCVIVIHVRPQAGAARGQPSLLPPGLLSQAALFNYDRRSG